MVKLKLGIFRSCRVKDPSTLLEHIAPACQRHKVITGDLRGRTLPPPSKQTPCGASNKSHEIASFETGNTRRINKCHCKDGRALSRRHKGQDGEVSPLWRSPARLSDFEKRMMWKVEGKVKESYVEVKRSQNPYEDFTKSMTDMILEKQLYSERDLDQLLLCFLSLNSRYHHGTIMEAFLDIWRTMVFNHQNSDV